MATDSTTELSARIAELLSTELLIFAESEDGQSVPWAVRPLTPEEQRSGVRFGDIHQLQADLMETLEPVLAGLAAVTAAAVVDAAGGGRGLLATLAAWRVGLPPTVAAEVTRALPVVEGALMGSYRASSRLVVTEAARQGVKISPVADPPEWSRALAETVTGRPVARVLDVARDMHSTPAAVVTPPTPEAVAEALADVSPRGPLDTARQANHAMVNAGRLDTWEAAERKPAFLYASEVMDGSTCPRCSAIDGTEWETLAEARAAYPAGQGYVNCDSIKSGGNRCRGTLVAVWED